MPDGMQWATTEEAIQDLARTLAAGEIIEVGVFKKDIAELNSPTSSTAWVKRLLEEVFTVLKIEEGELTATKREGRVTAQWTRKSG